MQWSEGLTGPALDIAGSDASPLRVMAGPGTGKSFAMKRRLVRLLSNGQPPGRILAVTFTRNAAAELIKDIRNLNVDGCDRIRAGTLHAYSFALLSKRDVFDHLQRQARPILTFPIGGAMQFEASPMLEDVDHDGRFGNKRARSKRVRAFEADWARLQSETPGWPLDPVDREFQERLIAWLQFHRAILVGELIPLALRYLRDNPASPELQMFDHVVVDEYQDLNRAEQVLLDVLAGSCQFALVGDEDQSIYSFRYAHPQGIRDFSVAHTGTEDKQLVECRRCPTLIVEMANALITRNHPTGAPPRLLPANGNPRGDVHVVQWNGLQKEIDGAAAFIKHLIRDRQIPPGEILLLSPRRLLGYRVREILREAGIPAVSFYHEEALKDGDAQEAFAYLTLLANPRDRVALRFLLGYPSGDWRQNQYATIRNHCEATGDEPWDALEKIAAGDLAVKGVSHLRRRFVEVREHLGGLNAARGAELVAKLFDEAQEWALLLREGAMSVLKASPEAEARQLYNELREQIAQPEIPQTADFVRIMSLHKSKGLTCRATILVGCIEGLVPSFIDADDSPQVQAEALREQRRLFYVGTTRAREVLMLSSSTFVEHGLALRMNLRSGSTIASRFLGQLGKSCPAAVNGEGWQASGFR